MTAIRFSILACSALVALTPTAQAENLLEIYQLAQQSDPTWNGAQANYRANLEIGPQARSLLLPTISAGAGIYKVNQEATLTNQKGEQVFLLRSAAIFRTRMTAKS